MMMMIVRIISNLEHRIQSQTVSITGIHYLRHANLSLLDAEYGKYDIYFKI